jgi:hypothetical protein
VREIRKDPRMKSLTISVFIKMVFAILTSSILIYLISLEFISHEDYQEEIDALYIIPRLYKKHYMEAIEELGGRLKYRLHNTWKDPKDEKSRLLPGRHPRSFSWTPI